MWKTLQRRTAGKARIDVVPPLKLVAFIQLPAQQDDAAIAERGKINQTAIKILQLDAEGFNLAHLGGKVGEYPGVKNAARDSAAALVRLFRGLRGFFLVCS